MAERRMDPSYRPRTRYAPRVRWRDCILLLSMILSVAAGQVERVAAAEALPESREEVLRRELGQVFDPERVRALATVLATEERSDEAVELLVAGGGAALSRGWPEAAIGLYERAAELAPDRSAIHVGLGRARLEAGQFEGAMRALHRARDLGESGVALDLLEAAAAWETGSPGRAEAIYRDLAAGSDLARQQLGRLLLWSGRPSEAVSRLRDRDGSAPRAPDLRLDLARALEGAGDLEEAERRYRELVEEFPGHTTATYGLGRVLVRQGRREEAGPTLERYRELYLRDQERVRRQGLADGALAAARRRVEQGDPEGALDRLATVEPSPDALALRAAALRALGDVQGARDALERAVALAPDRDDLGARLLTLRLEIQEKGT